MTKSYVMELKQDWGIHNYKYKKSHSVNINKKVYTILTVYSAINVCNIIQIWTVLNSVQRWPQLQYWI